MINSNQQNLLRANIHLVLQAYENESAESCLSDSTNTYSRIFHKTTTALNEPYLFVGEAELLGLQERRARHVQQLVRLEHRLGLENVAQLVQEPFVDLGEILQCNARTGEKLCQNFTLRPSLNTFHRYTRQ